MYIRRPPWGHQAQRQRLGSTGLLVLLVYRSLVWRSWVLRSRFLGSLDCWSRAQNPCRSHLRRWCLPGLGPPLGRACACACAAWNPQNLGNMRFWQLPSLRAPSQRLQSTQDRPKQSQDGLKMAPRSPRTAQRSPKSVSTGPKTVPRPLQEAPRPPQEAPRTVQETSGPA